MSLFYENRIKPKKTPGVDTGSISIVPESPAPIEAARHISDAEIRQIESLGHRASPAQVEAMIHDLRRGSPSAARPEVDPGEIEDILYDLISELNGLEDNEDAAEAAITEAAKALAALPPSPASTPTTNGGKA